MVIRRSRPACAIPAYLGGVHRFRKVVPCAGVVQRKDTFIAMTSTLIQRGLFQSFAFWSVRVGCPIIHYYQSSIIVFFFMEGRTQIETTHDDALFPVSHKLLVVGDFQPHPIFSLVETGVCEVRE